MIKNAQEAEEAWETEDGTAVPAAANGKIQFEEDYRFMMLRCWTLYDSMYYSDYVASKLFTWHHNGLQSTRERYSVHAPPRTLEHIGMAHNNRRAEAASLLGKNRHPPSEFQTPVCSISSQRVAFTCKL